jgi:preprotein translocase subunit SecE
LNPDFQASSSIGRAAVSKTAGWGFKSLLACHLSVAHSNVVKMNAKAEAGANGLDTLKLAAAAVLLVAGICSFYYFAAYSALLRVTGLLVIGGVAATVALQTEQGRRLWQFAGDARTEVRKVVWPTRQETLQTTLVVIVMVLVLGIILWLFDMMLVGILRFLTGQHG